MQIIVEQSLRLNSSPLQLLVCILFSCSLDTVYSRLGLLALFPVPLSCHLITLFGAAKKMCKLYIWLSEQDIRSSGEGGLVAWWPDGPVTQVTTGQARQSEGASWQKTLRVKTCRAGTQSLHPVSQPSGDTEQSWSGHTGKSLLYLSDSPSDSDSDGLPGRDYSFYSRLSSWMLIWT